jgi:MFS superfamily sulfate permease-like transporter
MVVRYENLESDDTPNRPNRRMMVISVIISVFVGLVVGCASMVMWAVCRIVDKATRQFGRRFERGRWLADLTTGGLNPAGRTRRILIVPGEPPGGATFEAHDPHPC